MTNPFRIITLEDAKLVLLPSRMPALAGAFKLSTHTWRTTLGRHQARVSEDTKYSAINDMWYSNSEILLSTDPGVELGPNERRNYLRFDDKLVLRIKHVGDSLRPWTQKTRRSREWEAQRRFPSIPPMPRLDFIYRLDITGMTVKDAFVMLSQDNQSIWRWQVWGYPINTIPATHKDLLGRTVYAHDDYSGVDTP